MFFQPPQKLKEIGIPKRKCFRLKKIRNSIKNTMRRNKKMGAQCFPLSKFLICALKNYRRLEKNGKNAIKTKIFTKTLRNKTPCHFKSQTGMVAIKTELSADAV